MTKSDTNIAPRESDASLRFQHDYYQTSLSQEARGQDPFSLRLLTLLQNYFLQFKRKRTFCIRPGLYAESKLAVS